MRRKTHDTPEKYLKAFLNGEERGFDFFFREYFQPLSFFAWQLIGLEVEAEDIVQQCFEKLWNRRSSLSHIDSVKSYLYTSIRHDCINFLKRRKLPVENIDIEDTLDANLSIEAMMIKAETIKQVHELMHHLPQRMREVFQLYYIEGKSYKEIGELLHTNPETVRNQRFKALSFIRRSLIPS